MERINLDNTKRGTLVWFTLMFTAFSGNSWISSITPLFPEIGKEIYLNSVSIGFITMLPMISFGLFYRQINKHGRYYRLERLLFVSVLLRGIFELIRVLIDNYWVFMGTSLLCAASAVGTSIVILLMIQRYFVNKRKSYSVEFAVSLSTGSGVASLIAVPMMNWGGSWKTSSYFWVALSFITAIIIWAVWPRGIASEVNPKEEIFDYKNYKPSPELKTFSVYTVGLLASTLLVFYALAGWVAQYSQIEGYPPILAGIFGSFMTILSVPKLYLSSFMTKIFGWKSSFPVIIAGATFWTIGIVGMWLWPKPYMVIWCILAGLASFSFGICMGMLVTRPETYAEAKWLTGRTMSWGYTISALGPFLFGVFYHLTHQWYLSFSMLLVSVAATIYFGWFAIYGKTLPPVDEKAPKDHNLILPPC